MNIYKMSRDELVAKAERDQAAIARAAGVLSDNAELQAKVRELRAELAAEKSKPAREVVRQVIKKVGVPTPCPRQADQIKRLEKNIASIKSQPPKEVVREVIKNVPHRVEIPTPCPKQADQIKALRSDIIAKDKRIAKADAEIERLSGVVKSVSSQLEKKPREIVKVQVVEKPGPEREVVKKVPTPCPKQAADIKKLQSQIASLRAAPPKEVVKEVVKQVVKKVEVPGPERVVVNEVPTPCPKQAAQVKALQSELAKFAKYDMTEFEKWRVMVDVARSAK